MAQTRQAATNTFTKGLIMDFNPMVAKNDCLTDALNATLLTFNGNEMQLQQDMGNGRVETAMLPEGYIPVGSCEYGDIIYIVSYNPLENKSQIGCFPSPERNISSEETSSLKNGLTADMFANPETGVVSAVSIKKILFGDKNLNPGDKYIVYSDQSIDGNANQLSDYGNKKHTHNEWPKMLKLKIVSIEDSGKIVDLDSTVKWYNTPNYYIANLAKTVTEKPDIDSYRKMLSSAYSVFQSKVSGKLAILAELETINGFSCTYDVYTFTPSEGGDTQYLVYFYTSWDTDNLNVNPMGFIFTESSWEGTLGIPEWDEQKQSYKYNYDKTKTALPYESGYSDDKYAADKVILYSRSYKIEEPGSYENFNGTGTGCRIENLEAQIINWTKAGVSDASNLRPITRITLKLADAGNFKQIPVINNNQQASYLFNLDEVEKSDTGELTYKTKASTGKMVKIKSVDINDDIINNYFHKDIPKKIGTVSISKSTIVNKISVANDLSKMIWDYKIAPAMPYGVLDYLAVSGSIDFSKIGTGDIDLTQWRYYNSGNVSTLTWGLDAYTEPNKGIAEVVFDFFDNQGFAASWHVTGKSSYAGTFTEQIILGQQNSSYKMSAVDAYGKSDYIHAGLEDDEGTIILDSNNKPQLYKEGTNQGATRYTNDVGTLYPNILYFVRITVKYCTKNILGEFNTDDIKDYKTFYRWYWTNGLFNDNYYSVPDFKILRPQLGLDFGVTFNSKGTPTPLTPKIVQYYNSDELQYTEAKDKQYMSLGTNVYFINQDGSEDAGNILMQVTPTLSSGYNTFNLNKGKLNLLENVTLTMGKSSITRDNDSPGLIHSDGEISTQYDDCIQPITAETLDSHSANGWDYSGYAQYSYGANNRKISESLLKLLISDTASFKAYSSSIDTPLAGNPTSVELYASEKAYENYIDSFSLNVVGGSLSSKDFTYTDINGDKQELKHFVSTTKTLAEAMDKGFKLVLTGIQYSKIFAAEMAKDVNSKVLKPILQYWSADKHVNSLSNLGLAYASSGIANHLYFTQVATEYMGESKGHDTRYGAYCGKLESNNGAWTSAENEANNYGHSGGDGRSISWNDENYQKIWKAYITKPSLFVPGRSTSSNGKIKKVTSNASFAAIKRAFGKNSGDGSVVYPGRGNCPSGTPSEWKNNDSNVWMINCIAIQDVEQGLVVPISDYFISKYNSQEKAGGSAVTTTLADMFGSLFSQLYVLDSSASVDRGLYKNYVTCENYNEYWNKDLIIDADINRTKDESVQISNINSLITIHTQTIEKYISHIKDNCGIDKYDFTVTDSNNNNVKINFLGVQKVIKFQYAVPYNVKSLQYEYSQKGESANKIELGVLNAEGDNPSIANFKNNIQSGKLYAWNGTDVSEFGSGVQLMLPSKFVTKGDRIYMVKGTQAMKSDSFGTLAKVISYTNGEVEFGGFNKFSTWNSTYNLDYDGEGDNPHFTDIPNISFFNLYNPGK